MSHLLDESEPLHVLVQKKFASARSKRDIVFAETDLAVLHLQSKLSAIPIQLRYCAALAKKPTAAETVGHVSKKKFDPFENPSQELLVAEVPPRRPTHNIVLNKYPVIENHFILSTKENKPQTKLLEDEDLFNTLACLREWQVGEFDTDNSLFAFFNSGQHSGASQPHRHLQFLPVKSMRTGSNNHDWQLLCNSMIASAHPDMPLLHSPGLDIVHYAIPLGPDIDQAALHQSYMLLLTAALVGISNGLSLDSCDAAKVTENGQPTFSYNLAMTANMMAILPRRSEAAHIFDMQPVFVNGTILAGTLMVKDEHDFHQLQQQPQRLSEILNKIAFSRRQQSPL